MKNIFYITFLSLLFCLTACHDLEEQPEGILNRYDVFQTDEDVESAVLGAYGLIASKQLYGQQLTLLLLLRSDMCETTSMETQGDRMRVNNFELRADNQLVEDIWSQSYQVIAATNFAIKGASFLQKQTEKTTQLVAEARFIRAFMYYHLIRLFGNIPYIDFTFEGTIDPVPQSNAAEIYPKILEDLTYAKEHLPSEQINPDDEPTRNRATKGTAAGFKASVHLTLEEYQFALEEAKWVIDNRDALEYQIVKQYKKIFRAKNTTFDESGFDELMLTFDFKDSKYDKDNGQNQDFLAILTGIYVKDLEQREGIDIEEHADGEGESKAVPYWKVYNLWDKEVDGDRRKANMAKDVEVEDQDWIDEHDGETNIDYEEFLIDRPHIKKYATNFDDINNLGHTDHNYIAMRFAEMYLIAAEAAYELGKSNDAIDYINTMRDREETDTQELPLSDDISSELILKERQLELAFEFKRWYDIIRKDLGPVTFGDSDDGLEPQDNFNSARDYLLPIPAFELIRDPNLVQNPGY